LRFSADFNGAELQHPGIIGEQPIGQQTLFETGDVFDRFGGLNRADRSGDGAENTGLLAIQNFLGGWRRVEETPIACGLAWQYRHSLSLQPNDARMGEGDAQTNRDIVHKKFRLEIITTVDNKIIIGGDLRGVGVFEANRIGFHVNLGIEFAQFPTGGFGFQAAYVASGVQDLAL